METKNQIQKMGNDIEGMLNDFEGGITEKEKTIIDILDYIVQQAEATVNNFKKELSKSLIGRIKFYKENNRPDNASTLEILLRDMQNDELLSFMEKDGFPVEAVVMPNEVLAGGIKRWKPKEKEKFYYVNFYTGVTEQVYTNSKIHTPRNLYKIGNCYKTKEEAQAKWDQIKKILIQR